MSTTSDIRPFATIDRLREAHALLTQQREILATKQSTQLLDDIESFVDRATRSGALLYDVADRQAAQSLINYWSNVLYRSDRELSDTVLAPFDQQLAPELSNDTCPYLGLEPFSERDRYLFFGRQAQVAELITRFAELRLLAVVGPSGSGKSSLVRAGIIPALRAGALPDSQNWRYLPPIVPGSQPLVSLARLFQPSSADPDIWAAKISAGLRENPFFLRDMLARLKPIPIILIVDQFEELFTLVDDNRDVQAFVDNLVNLIETPGPRHSLIITMRSDYEFESRISTMAALADHFSNGRTQVIPPLPAELREAITGPARQAGLIFEEGVVDLLVNDLAGDPAALPMLQFTLLQLWKQRKRNRITREVYERVGGGRRALEKAADAFFDTLLEQNHETGRRILLELVETRTLGEVTSRRIRRTALYHIPHDRGRIDRMLSALLEAGLLRLTPGINSEDDQVELAHEALIRNWPCFIRWLEEERDRRRTRVRLTTAAEQWLVQNRDRGALWLSRDMLADTYTYNDLSSLESEFVTASEQIIEQQEAQERRQLRRLSLQRLALAFTTLLALLAALTAFYQYRRAENGRRILSMQALADKLQSSIQSEDFIASATWLAKHSDLPALDRLINGDLPLQAQYSLHELLLQAILQEQRPLQSQALSNTDTASYLTAWAMMPATNKAQLVTPSRENASQALQLALLGRDHSIRIWQDQDTSQTFLISPTRVLTSALSIKTAEPLAMYWSHDAESLLTVWNDGHLRFVNVMSDTLEQASIRHGTAANEQLVDAQFSPDDRIILTRGSKSTAIRLWNRDTSLYCAMEHPNVVIAAGWLDTKHVFTIAEDKRLRVWSSTSRQCSVDRTIQLASQAPQLAVLAPSGALALGYAQGNIQILPAGWLNSAKTTPISLTGHTDDLINLAWNNAGQLISLGKDNTLRTWDLASQRQVALLRSQGLGLTHLSVAPVGNRVVVLRAYKQTTSDGVDIIRENVHLLYLNDLAHTKAQIVQAYKEHIYKTNTGDTTPIPHPVTAMQPGLDSTMGIPRLLYDSDIQQLIDQALPDARPDLATLQLSPTATYEVLVVTNSHLPGDDILLKTALDLPSPSSLPTSSPSSIRTVTPTEVPPNSPTNTPSPPVSVGIPTIVSTLISETAPPTLAPATQTPEAPTQIAQPATALPTIPAIPATQPLLLHGHTGMIFDARISTNNQWIATASMDGTARIWDMTGQQKAIVNHGGRVNTVEFNTAGSLIVTASDDNTARIWSVPDGQLLAILTHTDRVNQAVFSPDGNYVVTVSRDQNAKLWQVSDGKQLCGINADKQIFAVSFSPDNQHFALAVGDGTVRIVSLTHDICETLFTLKGHSNSVLNVRFSPDGSRIISSSTDRTVRIWDVMNGELLLILSGNTDWVRSPSISPDGSMALAAGKDGYVRVWNMQDGSLRWEAKGDGEMITARFRPNNPSMIVTTNEDGNGALWHIGEQTPFMPNKQPGGAVYVAEFSPDGQLLVIGGGSTDARVYNISDIR